MEGKLLFIMSGCSFVSVVAWFKSYWFLLPSGLLLIYCQFVCRTSCRKHCITSAVIVRNHLGLCSLLITLIAGDASLVALHFRTPFPRFICASFTVHFHLIPFIDQFNSCNTDNISLFFVPLWFSAAGYSFSSVIFISVLKKSSFTGRHFCICEKNFRLLVLWKLYILPVSAWITCNSQS